MNNMQCKRNRIYYQEIESIICMLKLIYIISQYCNWPVIMSIQSFRYYMYIMMLFKNITNLSIVLFKMLVIPKFHPVFLYLISFGLNEFKCTLHRVDCTAKLQINASIIVPVVMFTIRIKKKLFKKSPKTLDIPPKVLLLLGVMACSIFKIFTKFIYWCSFL